MQVLDKREHALVSIGEERKHLLGGQLLEVAPTQLLLIFAKDLLCLNA